MKVMIIIGGIWNGTFGVLQDHIPYSEWYNVEVELSDRTIRLALKKSEFVLL